MGRPSAAPFFFFPTLPPVPIATESAESTDPYNPPQEIVFFPLTSRTRS